MTLPRSRSIFSALAAACLAAASYVFDRSPVAYVLRRAVMSAWDYGFDMLRNLGKALRRNLRAFAAPNAFLSFVALFNSRMTAFLRLQRDGHGLGRHYKAPGNFRMCGST